MRALPGHLGGVVTSRGFISHLMTVRTERPPGAALRHEGWVGAHWEEDVTESIEVIQGSPDWIVVDHYGLDAGWETEARKTGARILAIDDLANRPHKCDLLLDQNLLPADRYDRLLPAACPIMLGPFFALLQPDYEALRATITPRQGLPRRMMIFIGGADSRHLLLRSLQALSSLNCNIAIDAVVGSGPTPLAVVEAVARLPHATLHTGLPSLAPLMAAADVALGAGGASSWERLCMGLPSLVVTIAQNQRPIAAALEARGLARWLGDQDQLTDARLQEAIGEMLSTDLDSEWSRRCMELVDGRGTSRVADVMAASSTMPLQVRTASASDEGLLLELANDPVTRQNSFNTNRITLSDHSAWLRSRLGATQWCRIYVVATASGLNVGQVRFERVKNSWEIGFSLSPLFRGRGMGSALLDAAINNFSRHVPGATLVGLVKRENIVSRKVFERLGFIATDCGDKIEYCRTTVNEGE